MTDVIKKMVELFKEKGFDNITVTTKLDSPGCTFTISKCGVEHTATFDIFKMCVENRFTSFARCREQFVQDTIKEWEKKFMSTIDLSIQNCKAEEERMKCMYITCGRRNGKSLKSLQMLTDLLEHGVAIKPVIFEPKCTPSNQERFSDQLDDYRYLLHDVKITKEVSGNMSRITITDPFEIKNVIFNPPATIVFWADGTKTVVQSQDGDEFDPEKGLAMAISKKALGNKHEYYNVFKHWLKKWNKPTAEASTIMLNFDGGSLAAATKNLNDSLRTLFGKEKKHE